MAKPKAALMDVEEWPTEVRRIRSLLAMEMGEAHLFVVWLEVDLDDPLEF